MVVVRRTKTIREFQIVFRESKILSTPKGWIDFSVLHQCSSRKAWGLSGLVMAIVSICLQLCQDKPRNRFPCNFQSRRLNLIPPAQCGSTSDPIKIQLMQLNWLASYPSGSKTLRRLICENESRWGVEREKIARQSSMQITPQAV